MCPWNRQQLTPSMRPHAPSRLYVPRQPQWALISSWFAALTDRTLVLYDHPSDLSVPRRRSRDLIVAVDADQLPKRLRRRAANKLIVAETATALNATLLDSYKKMREAKASIDWHKYAQFVPRKQVDLFRRYGSEPELADKVRTILTADSMAVAVNCGPSAWAYLALAANYAAAHRADLCFVGEIEAKDLQAVAELIEAIQLIAESQLPHPPASRADRQETPVTSEPGGVLEEIVSNLNKLTARIADCLDAGIRKRLLDLPPHYLLCMGDGKIPHEKLLHSMKNSDSDRTEHRTWPLAIRV